MGLFPIVLELAGRPCLVVGGGPVAERKVEGLLAADADVTVVSPTITELLAAHVASGVSAITRGPIAPAICTAWRSCSPRSTTGRRPRRSPPRRGSVRLAQRGRRSGALRLHPAGRRASRRPDHRRGLRRRPARR